MTWPQSSADVSHGCSNERCSMVASNQGRRGDEMRQRSRRLPPEADARRYSYYRPPECSHSGFSVRVYPNRAQRRRRAMPCRRNPCNSLGPSRGWRGVGGAKVRRAYLWDVYFKIHHPLRVRDAFQRTPMSLPRSRALAPVRFVRSFRRRFCGGGKWSRQIVFIEIHDRTNDTGSIPRFARCNPEFQE